MSKSNAERSENEKPHGKFIADFLHRYDEALRDATVAKEMTDTPAWRSIYTAHADVYRAQRKSVADRMVPLLETLQRIGWGDEDAKFAKDLVKDAVESREMDDAFKFTTLKQVTDAVAACNSVVEEATYKAEEFERDHGLTAHGIVDALADEVRATQSVRFDSEVGRVVIENRK